MGEALLMTSCQGYSQCLWLLVMLTLITWGGACQFLPLVPPFPLSTCSSSSQSWEQFYIGASRWAPRCLPSWSAGCCPHTSGTWMFTAALVINSKHWLRNPPRVSEWRSHFTKNRDLSVRQNEHDNHTGTGWWMLLYKWRKPVWKGHLLCDHNHVILQKGHNFRGYK